MATKFAGTLAFTFFIIINICFHGAAAKSTDALLSPISYDTATSLYSIKLGDKYSVLMDLAASNLWLDCVNPPYKSSTLQPVLCHSATCNAARICNSLVCETPGCISDCQDPNSLTCHNNGCGITISNSAISTSTVGVLWTDNFQILTTNGRNPGPLATAKKFAFACGEDLLLKNNSVPSGVTGGGGLSRAQIALPSQLAAKFSLKKKFTYCLPSTSNGQGVLFFGDSPIVFQPGLDFTNSFTYTPLLRDTTQPDTYYIGINSIAVNGVKLAINSNLLKIKNDGSTFSSGGATISTTVRYTQLESSIYTALAEAFKAAAKARGIKEVSPVAPFDTCFDERTASYTRVGLNVPEIDLNLQGSGGVIWRILGANSVVSVGNSVFCLAFERKGQYEPRSVVLGTFQQQDALLQYDLATSRLGFVSTILGRMATCSNFNFTT